jgi:mono/diheme cytochrome c family protein
MARKRKTRTARSRKSQRNTGQIIALAALGIGAVLIVVLVVLARTSANAPANVAASDDVLALGAEVYSNTCAACHGENGEGYGIPQAPALNETEHAWHHPDGQIQEIIKNGGKVMPALGDQLSDEEIVAVIRYIQTWWTADQLRQQQARSVQYPLQQ